MERSPYPARPIRSVLSAAGVVASSYERHRMRALLADAMKIRPHAGLVEARSRVLQPVARHRRPGA